MIPNAVDLTTEYPNKILQIPSLINSSKVLSIIIKIFGHSESTKQT
jgi:hypothetical protein